MKRRYLVKIDNTILPQYFTFDELVREGILDHVDENIKIRLEGDYRWVIARNFPFASVEGHSNTFFFNDPKDCTPQNLHTSHRSAAPSGNQIYPNFSSFTSSNTENTASNYQQTPRIIGLWNWGAFAFSWLWAVCNGIYWPLIIIAFNFIPYFGVVASLAICWYLGYSGNEIAWKIAKKNSVSIRRFIRIQRRWNLAGALFSFLVSLLLMIAVVCNL